MIISNLIVLIVFILSISCANAQAPVAIAPDFIQRFFTANNDNCSGCQLFVYMAGTTTKTPVYVDSSGSVPNTNPILMNSRGEPQSGASSGSFGIWLAPGKYKFVLAPANDSDPPTNPFWSIDNVSGPSMQAVPSSSSSACVAGQSAQDTNFLYICVSTDLWKRVGLSSF